MSARRFIRHAELPYALRAPRQVLSHVVSCRLDLLGQDHSFARVQRAQGRRPRHSCSRAAMPRSIKRARSSTPSRTPPSSTESSASSGLRRSSRRDPDVYAVEKLIARSIHLGRKPRGGYEHQYVVRWQGYGPEHDTWEFRSTLMNGSAELVKDFETRPVEFAIQGAQLGIEPTYWVRFGTEYSPLCEVEWCTPESLAAMTGIPLQDARRKCGVASKSLTRPKKVQPVKRLVRVKDYFIRCRARHRTTWVCARWKEGRKVKEDWMIESTFRNRFGAIGQAQLADLFASRQATLAKKYTHAVEPIVSADEYEAERKRNILENQRLMSELGFGLGTM